MHCHGMSWMSGNCASWACLGLTSSITSHEWARASVLISITHAICMWPLYVFHVHWKRHGQRWLYSLSLCTAGIYPLKPVGISLTGVMLLRWWLRGVPSGDDHGWDYIYLYICTYGYSQVYQIWLMGYMLRFLLLLVSAMGQYVLWCILYYYVGYWPVMCWLAFMCFMHDIIIMCVCVTPELYSVIFVYMLIHHTRTILLFAMLFLLNSYICWAL